LMKRSSLWYLPGFTWRNKRRIPIPNLIFLVKQTLGLSF
jgi:hypothetical protein